VNKRILRYHGTLERV